MDHTNLGPSDSQSVSESFFVMKLKFAVVIDVKFYVRSGRTFNRQVTTQFLPLSPPGWRGIVVTVRAGGRAAAKLAEPISL